MEGEEGKEEEGSEERDLPKKAFSGAVFAKLFCGDGMIEHRLEIVRIQR